MDSIYVVMPAYNEEENIRKTVKQWYPVLDGKAETSRLIIADSGSSDRTHELLTEMKKSFRSWKSFRRRTVTTDQR